MEDNKRDTAPGEALSVLGRAEPFVTFCGQGHRVPPCAPFYRQRNASCTPTCPWGGEGRPGCRQTSTTGLGPIRKALRFPNEPAEEARAVIEESARLKERVTLLEEKLAAKQGGRARACFPGALPAPVPYG